MVSRGFTAGGVKKTLNLTASKPIGLRFVGYDDACRGLLSGGVCGNILLLFEQLPNRCHKHRHSTSHSKCHQYSTYILRHYSFYTKKKQKRCFSSHKIGFF
jgi:hypothetical protein